MVYLIHCIADSIDLHNARAVNFLRKPSKTMSKYYFQNFIYFYQKSSVLQNVSVYDKTT